MNFFSHQVQPGSPAHGNLFRGDIITKIQDYDSRDIRNIDAKTLFRSATDRIKLVVRRDCKLAVATNIRSPDIQSRSPSAIPPYTPEINLLHVDFNEQAMNSLSNEKAYDNLTIRLDSRSSNFSPMPTRDHQQQVNEETAAITSQVSCHLFIINYFHEIQHDFNVFHLE